MTAIRSGIALALEDRSRTILDSGAGLRSAGPGVGEPPRFTGTWSASASFRASSRGSTDLTHAVPASGSYHGASALGLLWSERLTGRRAAAGGPPGGDDADRERRGRRLASTTMTQLHRVRLGLWRLPAGRRERRGR